MDIRPFDPHTATNAEWSAMLAFGDRQHDELYPDDPRLPHDVVKRNWQTHPPSLEAHHWVMWHEDIVVGRSGVWIRHADDNQHLADFYVVVLPEWRRQGLGRRLLAEVVAPAQCQDRTLLMSWTVGNIPAGAGFLEHLGALRGLETHLNQLELAHLDMSLMRRWQTEAPARTQGHHLEFIDGPYPEADLAAIARVIESLNDAPRGDLDVQDERVTPQHIREREAVFEKRGQQRWALLARHTASGEIAGWTEVVWNPSYPELLHQHGTGVLPKYRGLGLGRWLKAAMIERVVRDRPQVQKVRTGNADANAPMLKINYEMGFKPHQSEAVWQIELARVVDYLAATMFA